MPESKPGRVNGYAICNWSAVFDRLRSFLCVLFGFCWGVRMVRMSDSNFKKQAFVRTPLVA